MFIQLIHGLDIGIGLADTSFHLNSQVKMSLQLLRRLELICPLNLLQVFQNDTVGKLRQDFVVAPAGEILFIGQCLLVKTVASVHHVRGGKIWLSGKDIHHGLCCISLKFLMLKS